MLDKFGDCALPNTLKGAAPVADDPKFETRAELAAREICEHFSRDQAEAYRSGYYDNDRNMKTVRAIITAEIAAAEPSDEALVKRMANRFLMWKLPQPWHPDAGVKFVSPYADEPMRSRHWPVGTNLLDATQAEAMVRYMLGIGCKHHPDKQIRDTLDGDPLCQECCDKWVRGEGIAALKGEGA